MSVTINFVELSWVELNLVGKYGITGVYATACFVRELLASNNRDSVWCSHDSITYPSNPSQSLIVHVIYLIYVPFLFIRSHCEMAVVYLIQFISVFCRDLLNAESSCKLEVKMNPDGGLHVPGLSSVSVGSVEDVNKVSYLFIHFFSWCLFFPNNI